MWLLNFLYLYQWIILCNLYNFVVVKAISGQNVKLVEKGKLACVVSIMHNLHHRTNTQTYHICTGTLITKRHVLTAAHCFEGLAKNEITVLVRSTNLADKKPYDILWWITYTDWSAYQQIQIEFKVNDVAVVKLEKEVSDMIQPCTLSNRTNQFYYGEKVIMAGRSVTNKVDNPDLMEVVDLVVLTNTECENKVALVYGSKVPINVRYLCTSTEPQAFMDHGDSGGPLLSEGIIIGINQAIVPVTHPDPHPDKVNVHCGIEYYKYFILDVINNNFVWT